MRRADRLFQLIQLMRRRPVVTAASLARDLEVSERTVYRDIRDLMLSGVPIEGEAGVGYTLRKGFDLPPLMFTASEIEALVLGARVVQSWGDPALAKAASDALVRVEAALPDRLKANIERTPLFAPAFHVPQSVLSRLSTIRSAIDGSQKVLLHYSDAKGEVTVRTVRPLGLFFWGAIWSLEGWCELRNDFRAFRLDRMNAVEATAETFEQEPGKTLADMFAKQQEENDLWERARQERAAADKPEA